MRAFKWLQIGRVDPATGSEWPDSTRGTPGKWIRMRGLREPKTYAVPAEALAFGIEPELWHVDLKPPIRSVADWMMQKGGLHMLGMTHGAQSEENPRVQLFGRRGRLVEKVESWTPRAARDASAAFAQRARVHVTEALERVASAESEPLREVSEEINLGPMLERLKEAPDAEALAAAEQVCRVTERLVQRFQPDDDEAPGEPRGDYALGEAVRFTDRAIGSLVDALSPSGSDFERVARAAKSAVACEVQLRGVIICDRILQEEMDIGEVFQAIMAATLSPEIGSEERLWQASWLIEHMSLS